MIKDIKTTGIHFGKYSLPTGRFRAVQYFDFQCTAEQVNEIIIMSIIVAYCLDDKETGNAIVRVPCSTNFEFEVVDGMTVQDLMPLWKKSVKHLRDECNNTNQEPLKNIPYPLNDQIKWDIEEFLKTWVK